MTEEQKKIFTDAEVEPLLACIDDLKAKLDHMTEDRKQHIDFTRYRLRMQKAEDFQSMHDTLVDFALMRDKEQELVGFTSNDLLLAAQALRRITTAKAQQKQVELDPRTRGVSNPKEASITEEEWIKEVLYSLAYKSQQIIDEYIRGECTLYCKDTITTRTPDELECIIRARFEAISLTE